MIGDLLASITGEKPATSSASASTSGSVLPKRKAEDELRGARAKTPRTESPANGSLRPNATASKPTPNPAPRPGSDTRDSARPPAARRLNSSSQKPAVPSARNGASSASSANRPVPSRPLVNRAVSSDSKPQAEPKKRSFQEIMARAEANKTVRESFGKIQHKTIEKQLTMRERKELKAEEARKGKSSARKLGAARYTGTAAASRTVKTPTSSGGAATSRAPNGKSKAAEPPTPEVKKVKKAALATTGYTGTARPRPGAVAPKPGVAAGPAEDAKKRERSRYGGPLSRPRKYDDYDEELDDFIEYDDEEEEPGYGLGRGKGYDFDEEESDMEAGLSDIAEEESRAERQAIREDQEQQALEKRLKQEKEERKRRMMAARPSR